MKNCYNCNKEFKPAQERSRFCSIKCRDAYRYVAHPRKRYKKNCGYCRKELFVTPSRAELFKLRFCSREEHNIYLKEKAFNLDCIICGSKFYCQPIQVKLRNRKTCSQKCRSKYIRQLAEKRRIENGYTKHQLDRLIRYSPELQRWRRAVFQRDNYTCQLCGVRGTRIEADHIKPFAYFPELRFELSNGRTLCRPCHDTTKMSAKAMQEMYFEKTRRTLIKSI